MAYVHGRHFGKQLCDVLGIDPSGVRRIEVVADLSSAAYVVIERLVTTEEVTGFADEMKRFRTTARGEWERQDYLLEEEEDCSGMNRPMSPDALAARSKDALARMTRQAEDVGLYEE